ncbi:MAG TPA: HDIG domain-containing protein [Kofleriaceae bacterium]|nr:HDIG domain-containing protein [Kofleriaceae bacterium]
MSTTPRAQLAQAIARRPHVVWWSSLVIALGFAAVVLAVLTADRWIGSLGGGRVVAGSPAPMTVRVPPFTGIETPDAGRIGGGGGVVIARGDIATRDDEFKVAELGLVTPTGAVPYFAMLLLAGVFAWLFSHHTRRSTLGRLVRVQVVNLALVCVLAIVVKIVMLVTPSNVLIVPVAMFALVPTLVLDRVVGLATGTLAALTVSLCVPFDVGVAILLLVQVAVAGLVVAEKPKRKIRAILVAGGAATLLTALTYPLLQYLTTGHIPFGELDEPLRSAWIAAAIGPALATGLAIVLVPPYQLLAGEITQGTLIELEDLSQPLLKQISEKAPGTWQHSLMMANLAEIAANAIGANGRLVRVGAYYHDLGKSLAPKYFIENLEPGETSPHDKLPPEASCDAIFKHVTEGIVTARKAGLHERVIDFMHMHHGNGVLEYFWAKCQEQGNPNGLTIENFRYPGVPPQSRETAILAICDAVEAASRTLKKADPAAIDSLVQRIVYGKLHLGQLDDSGLSMSDLRKIADSLRETIRHANHGRIEYPWQRQEAALAAQSASAVAPAATTTAPRLDSLDREAKVDAVKPAAREGDVALAETDGLNSTPKLRRGADSIKPGDDLKPPKTLDNELANSTTAPIPLLEKRSRDSGAELATTGKVARDDDRHDDRPDERSTRDSRREADRAAMASRYANEPAASRDSGNRTESFARDSEPPRSARDSDPMSSRDGSKRVEHSVPSDGDGDTGSRVRANKRTNETGTRNRDFVANMVLEPIAKDGIPSINSDVDTGRHVAPQPKDSAKEIASFASEAARALQAAAPDLDILPPAAAGAVVDEPGFARRGSAAEGQRGVVDREPGRARSESTSPIARKRAATLPPTPNMLRPPTIQPPSRRAPTVPPPDPDRPIGKTLFGGAADLRTPAKPHPDPFIGAKTSPAVTRPVPKQAADDGDSATTQPALPRAEADSLGDATDPEIRLERASVPQTTWARGLAARIDLHVDDEFGRDTPTRAPSRAELQALVDTPPDATRQQSIEEIEKLQRDPAARRSQEELHFTPRRAPFPTAEVSEDDIEAAIEIAPSARRTGSIPIGIAKKKPTAGE